MKVSLKEARRIERRIQERALSKGYSLRSSLNIYDHESPLDKLSVSDAIKAASEVSENAVINTLKLISARSQIRRLIQAANETSGINSLIALREKNIRILSVWEDVINAYTHIQSDQAIKGELETKLTRAQNGSSEYSYASQPNKVEFVAVTSEFNTTAKENAQISQHNIDNYDDELLALNSLTKIEIPEDVYNILTENGVV